MLRGLAFTLACICLLAISAAAAPTAQYELKHTYALGGEGGWDYLTFDPVGKRMFIPRSTRVDVVDPYKGTVIGSIPNTPGVHGVALAPEFRFKFNTIH